MAVSRELRTTKHTLNTFKFVHKLVQVQHLANIQHVIEAQPKRRKNNQFLFQPWSWQWISMEFCAKPTTIESICITLVNVRITFCAFVLPLPSSSLSSSLLLLYFFCLVVVACFFYLQFFRTHSFCECDLFVVDVFFFVFFRIVFGYLI